MTSHKPICSMARLASDLVFCKRFKAKTFSRVIRHTIQEKKGKEERRTTQAAKSSSHQLRKRGHLGRKAPSPEKKKAAMAGQWLTGSSEDQEGCGQTSQQISPDWFEGEDNAQENVWSEQAYEHSA